MLSAMLFCVLPSVLQQPEAQVHPGDPLHRLVELEVGGDGVGFEITTDFEGTLHVWTESGGCDPRLWLQHGESEPLEDDNSGGGTAAYKEVAVTSDQTWVATVGLADREGRGTVRLHWVSSPETPETRAAANRALQLQAEAQGKQAAGDLREARLLVREALEVLREPAGSGLSHGVARASWLIGYSAIELDDVATCEGFWNLALKHRVRILPADHRALRAARQNYANIMEEMGDLVGARTLKQAVLEASERLLPKDHPDLLSIRWSLSTTLSQLGDYAAARALEEHLLEAYERLLPTDHPDLISIRGNLAVTMGNMGDLAGARALFEAVLEAQERLLPADHPGLLRARENLAVALNKTGDLPGARALLEAVLEAKERLLPVDHPSLLRARQNLAVTVKEMGDLAGARVLEEAVLEARERLLPEDHPDLLGARQNLAVTMDQMGDFVGARALLEDVLDASERSLSEDHPDLLDARLNLAGLMLRTNDFVGARALQETVLEALERLLPADHPHLLFVRQALAGTMSRMGETTQARELGEAVLAAQKRVLPKNHPSLLMARNNVALGMRKMGDHAGARALQEAVLEVRERRLPEYHPDVLGARQNLAITMYEMGDLAGARALADSLCRGLLRRLERLSILSPREVREGAAADAPWISSAAFLSESVESEGLNPLVFSLIETWRHVVSVPVRAPATVGPEWRVRRTQIQALREQLNDIVAGGAGTDQPPDEYAQDVRRLSLERDRLERELRSELLGRGMQAGLIEPARLSTSLPAGAISIGYRRLAGWALDDETGAVEYIGDRIIAHVVRRDRSPRKFDLGAVADFEELVADWRAALGAGVGRGVGIAAAASGSGSARILLAERLLLPILDELDESCTQLHICSDDLLFLIPIDALPLGDGRVGDRYRVVNEVSFGRLIQPRPESGPVSGLLVLGGAAFDASLDEVPLVAGVISAPIVWGAERSGPLSMFTSLEHTLAEVKAAVLLYEENAGGEAVVLGGVDATKAAFHSLAPGKRFLHLATHGWFAPESVPSILDDQRNDDLWNRMSAKDTVTGLAPNTLCGLAFAGANSGRDSLGRVPGIMTAEELMGIDLSACELAVLSACETNVGIRRAGQGIQSLQSALHAAGVRTAITSLWKVDDAATRQLMERFYTYLWVKGMGKADALWRAKCDLRAEGNPVRNWAAWVLSGDPN